MSAESASKKNRKGQKHNPCKKGEPNRKASARLEARLKDYFATVSDSKKDWKGYKKPGSMQGPR